MIRAAVTCAFCHGAGRVAEFECPCCLGQGTIDKPLCPGEIGPKPDPLCQFGTYRLPLYQMRKAKRLKTRRQRNSVALTILGLSDFKRSSDELEGAA